MRFDLVMEPYATMYQDELPEALIIDEFCFPNVNDLFERLGMRWQDFSDAADKTGRLSHDAALRMLAAIESHEGATELADDARAALTEKRQKVLTMLRLYREWRENPAAIPSQAQGILRGRAPGMAGKIGHLPERRPWLELR